MTTKSDAGADDNALVVPLSACAPDAAHLVGGKALGLGELAAAGLEVPAAFVVTTQAYRRAVDTSGLRHRIEELLCRFADGDLDAEPTSEALTALFETRMIDDELRTLIADAYKTLGSPPVAVRSSAVAEDRADASFAGQQDTYLWVEGTDAVIDRVVRCWASLFSARVLEYRARLEVSPDDVVMAVVVQRMVPARAAGVMMTLDPVTGDRATIYLESSYGLGEAVVAGEVNPDAFWIAKADLSVQRRALGDKQIAHQFDAEVGRVVRAAVEPERQALASVSDAEVEQLARLGREVEAAFGHPMDIEWAVADSAEGAQVNLLQARPETVWSSRPDHDPPATASRSPIEPEAVNGITVESWDPLHSASAPDVYWSASNVAEAIPGVMTPLSWSLWHRVLEKASLDGGRRLGVFSRRESTMSLDSSTHYFRAYYGRPALQVDYIAKIGDRLPGTSGEEAVKSILGRVPDDWRGRPTRRRLPVIAWRFPYTFVTGARRIRSTARAIEQWYPEHIQRVSTTSTLAEALDQFRAAAARFDQAVNLQVLAGLGVVMPVYSALERLIERRGKGDIAKLSGFGGAEVSGIVTDVWRASRGEISLEEAVARIGFHGPLEGEMSSAVWREDPAPLRDLIATYAQQDDSDDPRLNETRHRSAAQASAAELLAGSPAWQRPAVKALIRLAASRVPLRGVVKRSLLQALDGARASARRIGEFRAAAGELNDPTDVFYLTESELLNLPDDAKSLVARRRERRARYEQVTLPRSWKGMPVAQPATTDTSTSDDVGTTIDGVGVSAGLVEGTARVLHTPDFSAVRRGDVLVTPTTDPSWSSVMFLSSALVVDIGGSLSHAAVVARELGVPCVVNTRTGTSAIRTGDRVRVNGGTGVVEIIERADRPLPNHTIPAGIAAAVGTEDAVKGNPLP